MVVVVGGEGVYTGLVAQTVSRGRTALGEEIQLIWLIS